MPIYDYKCVHCDVVEERFVWPSEADEQSCEECKEKMKRLLNVHRVNFRAFPDQIIEALDYNKPITGYRDMRRKARSWENDEERKLLVDNLPTAKERKCKIETNKARNRENQLKEKTGGNLVEI
jgi:putative FmdB family regulatory protein